MRFRSKGLLLFLVFILHSAIWVLVGSVIAFNNIPSFSRAFYVLMGIPVPLFLSCCIIILRRYYKRHETSERERVFYKIISKLFIAIIIISVILTLICQYAASF